MKKLNNKGYALLETIIVSVFIISIFTFVYMSTLPLVGKYESMANSYDIDAAYKLYHIRDAMYKDSNFENMLTNKSAIIDRNSFNDKNYYDSLTSYLFEGNDYKIIYIRKLRDYISDASFNTLCNNLSIKEEFKSFIRKICLNNSITSEMEDFIFLNENGKFAYLGLAIDLNNPTNYKEPVIIDTSSHHDTSGANEPLLADGMIPVYFSDGSWHKADATNQSDMHYWYDYNDFMWANVVLVKESVRNNYKSAALGTLINNSDIMAFYVWIPRYEYYIDGTYGRGGTSKSTPGEIDVNFVTKTVEKIRSDNGITWRTASAFTFGSDELDGFWFGKFEMSLSSEIYNDNNYPYVVPEKQSWQDNKPADFYSRITTYMNNTIGESLYGLGSSNYTIDSHVMKNGEWGAVAYLSQSKYGKYGNNKYSGIYKEVYINNRANGNQIITGSSGGGVDQDKVKNQSVTSTCAETANSSAKCFKYYVDGSITVDGETIPGAGVGASTTGTVYGIYDMSGGKKEIIMGASGSGNTSCGNTQIYAGGEEAFTGFKGPLSKNNGCNLSGIDFPTDAKYYDVYRRGTLTGACNNKVCYSQAMSETSGWYDGEKTVNNLDSPWYARGGQIAASSTIFSIGPIGGTNVNSDFYTTRPIIAIY